VITVLCADKTPPLVFIGKAPPRRYADFGNKAAALALFAKAQIFQEQGGEALSSRRKRLLL
jgi:hypothetical protein